MKEEESRIDEIFIREKFAEYYKKNRIKAPENIEKREFGFGSWRKKIESRHYSFKNEDEMNNFLSRNVPMYISYSAGVYKFPTLRPIENKEWISGEIPFDVDADTLNLECKKRHGKKLICEKCMGEAKNCIFRLVEDFLIKDFGVSKDKIEINFSGNKGYHLHLNEFEETGRYGREEISDYVNGRIDYDDLFYETEGKPFGPKLNGGWGGRFVRTLLKSIESRTIEEFISKRSAKKFYEKRKFIEDGDWSKIYISNRKKFFEDLIKKIAKKNSCNIDEQVTRDITRLIRLPDSLHGSSGMVAKRIKNSELDKFDPLKDAIVFGDKETKIYVENLPEISLNDQTFGPWRKETKVVPEYLSIYLICKRIARLIS